MKKILLVLLICNGCINTNYIIDHSGIPKAGKYVSVALDSLNVYGARVKLVNQHSNLALDSLTHKGIKAYISKKKYYYLIVFNKPLITDLKSTIAHEVIHLEQYHSERLIWSENGIITYEGKTYNINIMPYDLHPWESEAYNKQEQLSLKIQ